MSTKVRSGFFIDGEFVGSSTNGATTTVISPSSGQVWMAVPAGGREEMDAAIRAARRAFDEGPWPRLSTAERAEVLLRACDGLERRLDEASHIQANEMGAPVTLGRMSGASSIDMVRELCAAAVTYPKVEARSGQWDFEIHREPYGVVAAISPWNGPVAATVMKGATALLAGCTVVDKPPLEAPISSLLVAEALAEAGLPAGAFNLVAGGAELGEQLVSSPLVDMVSFTGGTAVGKHVGRICGEQLKRVVLELGGKSAGVLLPDGDVSKAVQAVAAGVFYNSGQVCSGLTRLLVPAVHRDEVVDRLSTIAQSLRLGDPHLDTTQLGPLVSERHRDRVESYIGLGVSEGARLVTGGIRPPHLPDGWFVEPTVFANVRNDMRLAREEIFGPVASIITYRDENEAATIANDSPYGLNAAVFSADEARAIAFARGLRTGAVTINAFAQNFSGPRWHVKESGIGVRTGREGYEAHQLAKLVNIRPAPKAVLNTDLVT